MAEKEYSEDEKVVMNTVHETFVARWGEMITRSGGDQCKGGAYSYPGALDRYEKALGLKPAEAWLIKRLLSFDWNGKGYVWCSLRKISEEADVSYGQILEIKKSLEIKGYIRDMGQHGSGAFSQVRDWSIAGLLTALERAILCDPTTEYSKAKADRLGHPVTMADFWVHSKGDPKEGQPFTPFLAFTTPKQVNDYMIGNGKCTGWDPHYHGSYEIPKPMKRDPIPHTCSECEKVFMSASHNPATRCPKCRKVIKRQSLKPLVTSQ